MRIDNLSLLFVRRDLRNGLQEQVIHALRCVSETIIRSCCLSTYQYVLAIAGYVGLLYANAIKVNVDINEVFVPQ